MTDARSHLERIARLRSRVPSSEGTWGAKRELAAALRDLLERLPRTGASEAELRALLPAVRDAAARFAAAGAVAPVRDVEPLYAGMEDYHDVGPLTGLSNAVAPPLVFEIDTELGVARGRGRFGRTYEGAPGLLHGGYLAAAFDELLGFATAFSGGPGMTRELVVRYLKPTPIDVELHFVARLDRAEGRRLHLSAEVEARGVRTAEASGLFTAVGGSTFEAFDRARRGRG